MSWSLPRPRHLLVLSLLGLSALFLRGCSLAEDPEYCENSGQCRTRLGRSAFCHPVNKVCEERDGGCGEDEECTNDPLRPACDRLNAVCVACTARDDAEADECDHLGRRFCINTGAGPNCVECRKSLDCPTERPICDANVCRPCAQHSECQGQLRCSNGQECTDSWVCIGPDDLPEPNLSKLAGRCAANGPNAVPEFGGGLVVYAERSLMMGLCDDTNPGYTRAQPRCTIDAAVAQARADQRPYVRLNGSGNDFAPARISGAVTRVVIVGAPTPDQPRWARVSANLNAPLLDVQGGALVALDQVDFLQQQAGQTALSCSDSTLRVRRSRVGGATTMAMGGGAGVLLSNCDGSLIERSYVGFTPMMGMGHAIGVQVIATKAGSYTLRGNVIAGNTIRGIDLSAANAATAITAAFNTITRNGQPGQAMRALVCPGAPTNKPVFSNSIIADNPAGTMMMVNQFVDPLNCQFERIVVGPFQPLTDLGQDPITANPGLTPDFHLDTNNSRECCIDKIERRDGFPDRDIDGEPRPYPTGGMWDIGADEFRPRS